jgi:hypothetical protein
VPIDPFTPMAARFDRASQSLGGAELSAKLRKIGTDSLPDVSTAVTSTPAERGSLADQSMSGWGNAAKIEADVNVGASEFTVFMPGRSAGQMRVLNDGRQAYAKGAQRRSGTYTSKKTGETKVKYRTVNANVAAQKGKGTWKRAVVAMREAIPARAEAELLGGVVKIVEGG